MGSFFSRCCEVEITFRCTLCSKRLSPEPEVPIELSSTHNAEEGMKFIVIIKNDVGINRDLRISLQNFQYFS